MSIRIFKNIVSISCPDYTLRKVFTDKLKSIGFKIFDINIERHSYIWINEFYEYSDHTCDDILSNSYGSNKIRFATTHLDQASCDYYYTLPEDWYEAFNTVLELSNEVELKAKIKFILEDGLSK